MAAIAVRALGGLFSTVLEGKRKIASLACNIYACACNGGMAFIILDRPGWL